VLGGTWLASRASHRLDVGHKVLRPSGRTPLTPAATASVPAGGCRPAAKAASSSRRSAKRSQAERPPSTLPGSSRAAPRAPSMPIANENRLVVLTLWVHLVKITTKPAWSEPAHVARAGCDLRTMPPTHIQGLPPRRVWRSIASLPPASGRRTAAAALRLQCAAVWYRLTAGALSVSQPAWPLQFSSRHRAIPEVHRERAFPSAMATW
jgi:hypothetical protein